MVSRSISICVSATSRQTAILGVEGHDQALPWLPYFRQKPIERVPSYRVISLLDHGVRGSETGERAEILAQCVKDLGQPEAEASAATHLFPRHQEDRPQHQPLFGLGERRHRCPQRPDGRFGVRCAAESVVSPIAAAKLRLQHPHDQHHGPISALPHRVFRQEIDQVAVLQSVVVHRHNAASYARLPAICRDTRRYYRSRAEVWPSFLAGKARPPAALGQRHSSARMSRWLKAAPAGFWFQAAVGRNRLLPTRSSTLCGSLLAARLPQQEGASFQRPADERYRLRSDPVHGSQRLGAGGHHSFHTLKPLQ